MLSFPAVNRIVQGSIVASASSNGTEDLICVYAVWVASFIAVKESPFPGGIGSETSGTSLFAPFQHLVLTRIFFHTAGRKCGCHPNAADHI